MSIEKIEIFYAGYCINNEKRMFRKAASKTVRFPAACVLLKHTGDGYVLFDTGYSCENNKKRGLVGFLYQKLNPDYIDRENELVSLLAQKGISQDQITTVLISHIHPDHVGGLKSFSKAKYILSQRAYREYQAPKLKSLVFLDLFPKDFAERASVVTEYHCCDKVFDRGYDVFGDKNAFLVPLEGHACGQLGLYLPEEKLLFAADACWRKEYLGRTQAMRLFPKFLQHNFKRYEQTQGLLTRVGESGINIIYSHDMPLENGAIK